MGAVPRLCHILYRIPKDLIFCVLEPYLGRPIQGTYRVRQRLTNVMDLYKVGSHLLWILHPHHLRLEPINLSVCRLRYENASILHAGAKHCTVCEWSNHHFRIIRHGIGELRASRNILFGQMLLPDQKILKIWKSENQAYVETEQTGETKYEIYQLEFTPEGFIKSRTERSFSGDEMVEYVDSLGRVFTRVNRRIFDDQKNPLPGDKYVESLVQDLVYPNYYYAVTEKKIQVLRNEAPEGGPVSERWVCERTFDHHGSWMPTKSGICFDDYGVQKFWVWIHEGLRGPSGQSSGELHIFE